MLLGGDIDLQEPPHQRDLAAIFCDGSKLICWNCGFGRYRLGDV